MKASDNPSPAKIPITGVLVIDKPVGLSSMQAVARVRRKAGGIKTGHAGTLDPLADGVLVLGLGRATKLLSRLMDTTKRYRTVIDLSAFTTTDDREGEREEIDVTTPPDRPAVEAALTRFNGRFEQTPPAFSAIKVGGRRSYALARKGAHRPAEIAARPVTVHELDLLRYDWPELELAIHCDKGFYVRALARDLGEALATGGHCASIRRTAVGPFDETMAVALDDVPEPLTQDDLIPPDRAMEMVEAAAGDRG